MEQHDKFTVNQRTPDESTHQLPDSVSLPISEQAEEREHGKIQSEPSQSNDQPAQSTKPELDSHVLKLKGLPYSTTPEAIRDFFTDFNITNISFVFEPDGRPSGLGFAEFNSKEEAMKALAKNGEFIGDRYIRLLHVPVEEMEEQVRHGTSVVPGNYKKGRQPQQQQQQQPPLGMDPRLGYRGQMGGMPMAPSGPIMLPPHLLLLPPYANQNALAAQSHALSQWSAAHIDMTPWQPPSYGQQDAQLNPNMLAAQIQNMSILSSGREGGLRQPSHVPRQQIRYPVSSPDPPIQFSTHPRPLSHPPTNSLSSNSYQQDFYSSEQHQQQQVFPQFDVSSTGAAIPQASPVSSTVKVRGLPYRSTPVDILSFFIGYQYLPDSLQIGLDNLGRPSGEAWLTFVNPSEAARAARDLNRQFLGNRYLELCIC